MSFFGACFASLTLMLPLHWSGTALAMPFLGFAAIAGAAALVVRRPGPGFARPNGAGRVMMWSSIGEGVGLFLINDLLINLGRPDLILPSMVLVVGLHFVPIARWSPFRPLYVLAAVMVAGGVAGLLMRQPAGGATAGFTAAAALAAASLAALRREALAKAR